MKNKADISIMGCGWLGLPLAKRLVQIGYRVKGSTTSPEKVALLAQQGIAPFCIDLADKTLNPDTLADFLHAETLVLNIPPKLRSDGGESYRRQMRTLEAAVRSSGISRVLFVSSTSVYLDLNRVVTEEDTDFTLDKDPDNSLLHAERLFQDQEDWVCTVVRFGGLVGGDRQPARYLAGKLNLPNGDAPVNLIHLEDCIQILQRIIEQQKWGQVYNACSDEHPSRRAYYEATALALGITPPSFLDMQDTQFKLISSQRLKDDLAYVFLHPDPMGFF